MKELNEQAYRHEYLGEPTGSGGEVFPNLEMREITDDEIKQMQYFYCGCDFGFSVDPCAVVYLSYDRKTQTLFFLDEIYRRGMTNSALADAIKAKHFDTSPEQYFSLYAGPAGPQRQLIVCDSAEPKSIADLRAAGINAVPCKKFPGSVNYGIKWLQSKRIIIDAKRCPHSWEEFSAYEYETTRDGEFLATVPDANNHTIDSCHYALDRLINGNRDSA